METNIYLDCRTRASRGYPLKVRVSFLGKPLFISLGVFLEKNQWDSANNLVIRHPDADLLTRLVMKYWGRIDQAILQMKLDDTLFENSPKELKEKLIEAAGLGEDRKPKKKNDPAGNFVAKWKAFASSRKTEGNQDFYWRTLKVMQKFDPTLPSLCFEQIDRDWLLRFDKWLDKTHCQNSKNIHYRNIRAVFNDAIDDGLTTSYPFRKFKIKNQETRHRNLSPEELRSLFVAAGGSDCIKNKQEYVDLFKLSFFLIGINLVDMRDMQVVRGRVEYRRAKTHKLYDIKLEPEAAEIIKRYAGGKHTVSIFDRYTDYHQLNRQINHGLGALGRVTGKRNKVLGDGPFKGITYYWARHSWASIASEIDIPFDVIAHALGHGSRTVTDVYINFNQKKIDDANRKVMDYVLYGKDWRKERGA